MEFGGTLRVSSQAGRTALREGFFMFFAKLADFSFKKMLIYLPQKALSLKINVYNVRNVKSQLSGL